MLCQAREQLGGEGYNADWFRANLADRGIAACIPSPSLFIPRIWNTGLVSVLRRSPISLYHLGFKCERADAAQI